MVQDALKFFTIDELSVHLRGARSLSVADSQLEETILEQLDISMVGLDSNGSQDYFRHWVTCLAPKLEFTFQKW